MAAGTPLLLDRYRVLGSAGKGGFGVVTHAYDTRLRRDVAIKSIPLSESDQAKAHLAAMESELGFDDGTPDGAVSTLDLPGLDEARAAAQLSDPHIVTVYDFEIHDGVAYLIMEYIEGRTLTELLHELGDEITLDEIAAIVEAVAGALTTAHKAGVLHLDVKPDNVLIDDDGVVKVTDFGLAAIIDGSGTGTTGGGTVGYMPLEQMRREPLDERTDEWALAAMTYTMLTGSNPYEVRGALAAAEAAIETTTLEAPSDYWAPLGDDFDAIIAKALAPFIENRYPSVEAFAKALKPFLGSAKEGTAQLRAVIQEGIREQAPPPDPPVPTPLVDRIGEAGARLILRSVATLGAMVVVAVALIHIPQPTMEGVGELYGGLLGQGPLTDTTWGVASATPWLFWLLVAAFGVLTAALPSVGVALAWILFAFVAGLYGQWQIALGVLVATVLWWLFVGRAGPAEAMVGVLGPMGGAVGFAALAPVAAGTIFPPVKALIATLFSIVGALVFSGYGSMDLMGWNALIFGVHSPVGLESVLGCALDPQTWCVAASWVVAALVLSFFGSSSSQRTVIIGAFIACALLITGVCLGAWFASYETSALPDVFPFIGALFPGILGIIFAILGVNRKSREGDEEQVA